MKISPHLIQSITRELTTRANRNPSDRLAAEFISTLKKGKHTVPLEQTQIQPLPTEPNYAEMTEEELVRAYFADLGEPLTMEQHNRRELEMKELEKLPYEEVL